MIARALRPLSPAQWIGAPIAACAAASLLLAVPVRVIGFQAPEPVFALVPAFAWAIARPAVTPPVALVILGLFLDLLWGDPLGHWPLCLLAAYTLIFCARRILSGQEFLALWGAYALACAAAEIMGLALASLHAGHVPGLPGAGSQFVATVALFPFAWRLIERYEAADARYR